MAITLPQADLDPRFSSPGAKPTGWDDALVVLENAEVYWLSTVRLNGHPHVSPIAGVWLDESLYFCTGPTEQKARNIAYHPHCVITTGCNGFSEGLDVTVEGAAMLVIDESVLHRLADAYAIKYDGHFHFKVLDGAFVNDAGGRALVFEVEPKRAFGFRKGEPFSQTRWRFSHRPGF